MVRFFVWVALASAAAGCGRPQPSPVASDPESIKALEEQQRKAARGEG